LKSIQPTYFERLQLEVLVDRKKPIKLANQTGN
jgi:hypothetical protein